MDDACAEFEVHAPRGPNEIKIGGLPIYEVHNSINCSCCTQPTEEDPLLLAPGDVIEVDLDMNHTSPGPREVFNVELICNHTFPGSQDMSPPTALSLEDQISAFINEQRLFSDSLKDDSPRSLDSEEDVRQVCVDPAMP